MSTNPPQFCGKEETEKALEWLWKIEKAFDISELPDRLKLNFGIYMLAGNVES